MAAPTVLAELPTTPSTANSTSYAVTVPAATAGEVLECKVGSTSNGDLSTTSTGWKLYRQWKFASGLSMAIFRKKIATGSDSLTITSSTSARFSALTQRFVAGTRLHATQAASATATGSNSNPPNVNHRKATRETLYEAWRVGAGTVVPSASPSGYGTRVNNQATSGGVSITVARKTATSASDDPGTFTSSSALWGCITVAHWIDVDGPALTYWKNLVQNPTKNPVVLAVGTSNTTGTVNADDPTGGGNTHNNFAISRPAIWAAGMTAMPAAVWMCGNGGLIGVTNTSLNAYNNRFSAGSSMSTTDQAGTFMLGKGAPYIGTSGQKMSQVIPQNFDRLRVWTLRQPGSLPATIDVNGGTPQTVNAFNGTLGVGSETFIISGSSGDTANVTINSAGGPLLAMEAWTDGVHQIQIFNAGWFAGNSAEMANSGAAYNSVPAILAMAPDLTIGELNCNDGLAGFTLEQVQENTREIILAGKASGDFMYTMWPFTDTASEAATAYFADAVAEICDELGARFFNIQTKPNWDTRAHAVAAGFTYRTDGSDAHSSVLGYSVWGGYELSEFDPGPGAISVSPSSATHGHAATSPTLAQKSALTVNGAAHGHAASAPSLLAASVVASDGGSHGHEASSPSLASATAIFLSVALHEQSATSPALTASIPAIVPNAGDHGHAATSPALAVSATVSPVSAAHVHAAGSPSLSVASVVAPLSALHVHASTSPTLAVASAVVVAGAAHGHVATSPSISAGGAVLVGAASHGHVASSPAVALRPVVVPGSASHGLASTSPSLAVGGAVSPNGATHAQAAGEPPLTPGGSLAVAGALHAVSSTGPSLSFRSAVSPESAQHASTSSLPSLSPRSTVAPATGEHGHAAGQPALSVGGSLSVGSAIHTQTALSPQLGSRVAAAPDGATHLQTASAPVLLARATISPLSAAHAHSVTSPLLVDGASAIARVRVFTFTYR